MVRVVCQNFQRPRSRHSSGESPYSVDTDLARRTCEALATMTSPEERRFDSDTETSSDVYWDSEGGTCWDNGTSDSGAEPGRDADVLKKRRARRRERNKKSAQAYRQRRKEQTLSQQKVLSQLEEHQKELLQQIQQLEAEKNQVEKFLRSCFTQGKPDTTQLHQNDVLANMSVPQHTDSEINNNNNNNNNNNCGYETLPQCSSIPKMMLVS